MQNIPMDGMGEWGRLLLLSRFGIEEVKTKLNIINEEYEFLHDYNPIEHIYTRIKKPQQIIAKLERMGVEPNAVNAYKHLHDVGGVRVVCSFARDVYTIAEQLKAQRDITVLNVKDYIQNPKPNGYRSLHLIVEVPVFLTDHVSPVTVEIQLRSVSMDLWASIEHKIYYKSGVALPAELSAELTDCAEELARMDTRLARIQDEIKWVMATEKEEQDG
ncbi:MAG: GTP pyrophosphokinase family protein [Oscillospiraceae bacterium]|nr:GTP pyrophosphokinase family protein [Oscillospiraceae bacterium]